MGQMRASGALTWYRAATIPDRYDAMLRTSSRGHPYRYPRFQMAQLLGVS